MVALMTPRAETLHKTLSKLIANKGRGLPWGKARPTMRRGLERNQRFSEGGVGNKTECRIVP
jgi:hypothetical protein